MTQGLSARFTKRLSRQTTIAVDLDIPTEGFSITALFGPSGSGKTVTLRCLAGLDRPDGGTIRFGSEIWFDSARSIHRMPQQRGIGYLFQDYALFPHLHVAENIAYGLAGLKRADVASCVNPIVRLLGLDGLQNRYPRQLSGGEQQRVALARVFARRPRLALLDEPLSALDGPTRERLRSDMRVLLAQFGIPVILVTHDRGEAAILADRLAVIHQGRILQQGTPEEVFSRPATLDVARIVGTDMIVPGRVIGVAGNLATIAVGTIEIRATTIGALPRSVHVCLRAEAVGLGAPPSEVNHWPARIAAVHVEGAMVRVELDCGLPLSARLTKREWQQHRLAPGMTATAWIDPDDVHCLPQPDD
jgi:molybdate transport system ATP-binding protein